MNLLRYENDIRYFTSIKVFDNYVYSLKWTDWYFTKEDDGI